MKAKSEGRSTGKSLVNYRRKYVVEYMLVLTEIGARITAENLHAAKFKESR